MKQSPLVTVICICHNQKAFVEEAIQSVFSQTYLNIELIVVDDASTDGSVDVISNTLSNHPDVKYIRLSTNVGLCKAFNRGLAQAHGEFVIDFAADDVMLPDKIEKQVEYFSTLDESYGVVFTDALYIDRFGKPLRKHYEYLFKKKLLTFIPQGNVYPHVLSTYFISGPTMLVRRKVFDALKGYDENLAYEDFDFWVRSSRIFKYAFLDRITTKVRLSEKSMSTGSYKIGDKQLRSTFEVCVKALSLNQSEEDFDALASRLKYEIRQSVFSGNREEAELFYGLLRTIGRETFVYKALLVLNKLRLPLARIRILYHNLRYNKR